MSAVTVANGRPTSCICIAAAQAALASVVK
jgi:hypothetical protein